MNNLTKDYLELEWDSNLFGYKVAKLSRASLKTEELSCLLNNLAKNEFNLIYWSVDPNNRDANQAALDNHGFLADKKVTYLIELPGQFDFYVDREHLQSYSLKPINKRVINLALQSGIYSRFKVDPHFINNEFTKLYSVWIKRSINKEIAREVLVYIENNIEVGLITLGEKNNRGDIGILAVDKSFRGKSIGKYLVFGAIKKFRHWGYKEVQAVTQQYNVIACRFYEKVGFKIDSIRHIYHFWLQE